MKMSNILKIKSRVKNAYAYIKYINHCYSNKDLPESVYFYTFHKCASTLFTSYILKNINGLYNVDYSFEIYSGRRRPDKKLMFRKKGIIYGPIRLSDNKMKTVGKAILIPTTKHEFIQDKIAIFMIRDPRDILVSEYYSFGFSHGFSPVKEIKESQETKRENIHTKSLDEYVLESATKQAKHFESLYEISNVCERSIILKYEEMINDFEHFIEKLRKFIALEDNVVREIYQRSRPRENEDTSSHRRSGQVGNFRNKLKEGTVKDLNKSLAETLALFGYEA